MSLVVAAASHDAAKYACETWHYSGCLPTGKIVKIGVWEDDQFIGVVLFSRGASPWLGDAYGLDQTEVCELTRVALRAHKAPVSQIVSAALAKLRASSPGLRLVVSFADPSQGHHGGIYQAGNWIYTGASNPVQENYVRGKWRHVRGSYHEAKRSTNVPTRTRPGKHRYVFPLDKQMRRRVSKLAQPYPTPCGQGLEGEPANVPLASAGSTPAVRSNEEVA